MNAEVMAELERGRARIAQLEGELMSLTEELKATNEGVLALYAELDEAQTELTRKNQLVLEADRLKGEFLANMSHEIRTPMNAIIGLTEALLSGPLNDHQRESLRVIRAAGNSLLALINDILDFSKIEAGMLDLDWLDFAPSSLLETTVELLRGLAEQKNLQLRVQIDPNLPPVLKGDPNRLRQILLNLIGNAIKFTDRGQIRVSLRSEGSCELVATVEDEGRGIPPEVQARLFQPFVQGDGSITREHGGTGLGLSICRRLVELMKGEIKVESAPGKGSTFQFRIPLAVSEISAMATLSAPVEPGRIVSASGWRILVAEDHLANQMVVKYQLESLGLSADFVNNGREAVQASGEHPYDLILMDCHMPEMSGYEATREIRRRQEGTGKHIPIVAMTAGALAGDREKCLQAGMDDYISKPVDATTLGTLLASWLRDREVDDPARGDPGDAAPIDFEALEDTYGAPNAASLARLFEEDASREITLLEQAVKQHDLAGVAAHAHGLRGLCGAICAPSMIAQCDRLRQAKILEDWGAIAALTRSLGTELRRAHDLLRERYP